MIDPLFIQGRGALKRELVGCLRTGRALRVPRARARRRANGHVTPEVMISQRPAEAEDRAVPGRWEGDLIIGTGKSAIGTLVERTTRFTLLLHLPRMEGFGVEPRVKNGPALAGLGAEAVRAGPWQSRKMTGLSAERAGWQTVYELGLHRNQRSLTDSTKRTRRDFAGALAVRDAIATTITTLPEQLRRSLTWDRGKELAQHARLRIDTGPEIYFADPHSPWQRGTNENTNGLLRQYFPKGTDLSRWQPDDLAAVALALNSRPRKTFGWKTPAEALNERLLLIQEASVATTD